MITIKMSGRKGGYVELINKAADTAFKTLGISGKIYIELDFVSSIRIRELNLQFRSIDKSTDVLSFPFLELTPYDYPTFDQKSYPLDVDEKGQVSLGSIVICSSIAKKQAISYCHSVEREVAYLFVHGLLHLLGFDHIDEKDKAQMRGAEEKIMEAIELKREA